MADIFTRRRTRPPHKNNNGLSPRDLALARIEALLREELLPPPVHEETEPSPAPEPVNPEEAVEIARISPPAKPAAVELKKPLPATASPPPAASPQSPPGTSSVHVFLQAVILVFVLGWVFILGIIIGRGHLWESGPVHDLVLWVEEKAGLAQEAEPPAIFVWNQLAEVEDEAADWEAVRREFGYSYQQSAEAGFDPGSSMRSREPEPSADIAAKNQSAEEPVNGGQSDLTNSQWLNTATSLLNYDSPAEGYQGRGANPALEEAEADDIFDESEAEGTVGVPAMDDEGPEPEAAPRTGSVDAAMRAESGDGKYAVQVASPYAEEEARRRVDKLQDQGLPAYYYQTPGGRYPVRVGRFATYAQAAEAQTRLETMGYKNIYISTLTD